MFLISVLVFKMGIAPLNIDVGAWHEKDRDLLFNYPMTTIYLVTTDIDWVNRKKILENFDNGQWIQSSLWTNVGIYVWLVSSKVYNILNQASWVQFSSYESLSGSVSWTQLTALAKAAFYISLVFMFLTINMKIFTMLMTRFIGIIIHSVFIPLNVAMLWSPYVEKIWLRSLVSYMGSLLITPIIYWIAWFWITILLTFKTNIMIQANANASTDVYLYSSLMLILWYWLYTFIYQVSQNFGSELENIILGYSGKSGYDSSADVQQWMGAAKQYLWIAAMQQGMQQVVSQGGTIAAWKVGNTAWALWWAWIAGVWKAASILWANNVWWKIEKFWMDIATRQAQKLAGIPQANVPPQDNTGGTV
jgi:hypothetical protein